MTTIIRNEKHIESRRRIGLVASFAGMGVLLGGLLLTLFNQTNVTLTTVALLSLPVGWILSQIGLYFANRYVRRPRPDESIDEGLSKIGKAGRGLRIYHYVLPAPHVILSPAGIITMVAKYQSGDIVVEGRKWKQTGVGVLRRLFGQEGLGNPSLEAEYQIKQIAQFISREVPDLAEEDLPIGALVVFTAKTTGSLDLRQADFPAMHYSKLSGFWKQRKNDEPLPEAIYEKLRAALDAAAEAKTGLAMAELVKA